MLNFETSGIAGLYLKYSGNLLDTAISIDPDALRPPSTTYMRFTTGLTGLEGATMTGATSTAVCQVMGVVITAGTLAGGDAEGIVFVKVISGIPQTGENWAVPGIAVVMISRSAIYTIPAKVLEAKSIVIIAETGALKILWDGSNPTNSTKTGDASFGVLLNPGDSYLIKGWTNCQNLKMINAVAATNGVANVLIAYGGVE